MSPRFTQNAVGSFRAGAIRERGELRSFRWQAAQRSRSEHACLARSASPVRSLWFAQNAVGSFCAGRGIGFVSWRREPGEFARESWRARSEEIHASRESVRIAKERNGAMPGISSSGRVAVSLRSVEEALASGMRPGPCDCRVRTWVAGSVGATGQSDDGRAGSRLRSC